MRKINSFVVQKGKDKIRLDKFLKGKLPQFSRRSIERAIKRGDVLVNHKKIKPSYLLRENDLVFYQPREKISPPVLKPLTLSPEPRILYEDKNLLVLNKPAGLVVHPTATTLKRPSLAAWLTRKYPFLQSVGEDKLRPGIVHRLDKDTSGVLVVAKNNPTFFYLKNLFKKRKIHKKYLALVEGEMKKEKGIIERSLLRSQRGPFRRRVVYPKDRERNRKGKTAITLYKVKKRYRGYTLLEVSPQTGRTHQIRVHLASIGYPIVGDRIYGKKKRKAAFSLSRHFLHAQMISFFLPSGEFLEVEAPLPKVLSNFLNALTLR